MMLFIRMIAIVLMTVLLGACSSGGGSSSSISTPVPGGSVTTTLSIAKATLTSYGTTTVKAVFMDSGKPIQGLNVTFSGISDLATFNPSDGQAITDETGTATVLMTATNSTGVGQVTVTATVKGNIVKQLAPFYVNTPALHLGNLTYNNTVTRGGSLVVSADILDSNGNLYTAQNIDVYFNANYGHFVADNNVGKVRSSAGKVTTTYFSDFARTSAAAFVDSFTLTLGSSVLSGNITINPPAAVNIIYTTSLPAKTTLAYNESMAIYFKVVDADGIGSQGKQVSFAFTSPPTTVGHGATIQATTVTTDYQGYATAVVKAGRVPATLLITAYLGNSTTSTTAPTAVSSVITVGPATAALISSPTVADTLVFNGSKTIVFNVKDYQGVNLPNQLVTFSVVDVAGVASTNATVQSASAYTDASGNATALLLAKTVPTVVRVKAVSNSISAFSSDMTISNGTATTLSVKVATPNITSWTTIGSAKVLVNPASETAVTITATDALGNAAAGLLVFVSTDGGAIKETPAACTTGASGSCSVTWINSKPELPATGLATVTATSSGATSGTGTIIMSSAEALIDTSSCAAAMPITAPATTATQSCFVLVSDINGKPLGSGSTVAISVAGAGLTPGTYSVTPTSYTVPVSSSISVIPITITKSAAGDGALSVTATSHAVVTGTTLNIVTPGTPLNLTD